MGPITRQASVRRNKSSFSEVGGLCNSDAGKSRSVKAWATGEENACKSLFHNGGAVESGPRTVYTPYPADRSPLADIPNDWGGPKDVCPTNTKLC